MRPKKVGLLGVVGFLLNIIAVTVLFAGISGGDFRQGLRSASLLAAWGMSLIVIERWRAPTTLSYHKPYQRRIRQVMLGATFAWPAGLFLWSYYLGMWAIWLFVVSGAAGMMYTLWALWRHAQALEEQRKKRHAVIRTISNKPPDAR